MINLTYDLFGRPRTITHPKIEDRRTYAGASGNYRLTQIQTVAGTQTQTTRMQYDYADYDALGRLKAINDTTPHKPSATDNGARYTYDALGLTNAQLPRLGNANFADTQNGYDNLTKKDNVSLTYDTSSATAKPHQPKMYNGSNITHDANGNRYSGPGTATYGFDPEGRLNAAGNEAFVYDHAGRRVIRRVGSGLTTRYFNRLFEADSDGTITKYYYAGPLLIASTHKNNGQFAAADFHDAVRFAARSLRHGSAVVLLLRRDVQIGLVASVLLGASVLAIAPWGRRRRIVGLRVRHGHRIGAAVIVLTTLPWPIVLLPAPVDAQCQPQPIASHYSLDHLGSTQLVTTPTGDVGQYVRYKPYGDPSWFNGDGTAGTFNPQYRRLFTGYEWDQGTELYYAGARWYHPATATFLSHDPARQFASPYTYVNWDPVNRTDPNGDIVEGLIVGLVVGLVLAGIASAIDTYVRTGNIGLAARAGAAGTVSALVGPNVYGLQFLDHRDFGKPNAGAIAISLIPIGGCAYGAAQSFKHGNYASGVLGAVETVASILAIAYAAYEYFSQGANGTAPGAVQVAAGYGNDVVSDAPGGTVQLPEIVVTASRLEGLQAPLIDPIDIVAGLFAGAVMAGMVRGATNGAAATLSRTEAAALVKSANPVGAALKSDAFHRSASFVVDDIAQSGSTSSVIGADGATRTLVQLPGGLNGIAGRFEWLVDSFGQLVHQRFVPGGTINGIPNVP